MYFAIRNTGPRVVEWEFVLFQRCLLHEDRPKALTSSATTLPRPMSPMSSLKERSTNEKVVSAGARVHALLASR